MGVNPATLSWKNISQIRTQIRNKLITNNGTLNLANFLTLCSSRTQFYQTLGAKYSNCINQYRLLALLMPGENPLPAFEYQDFWAGIDFDCNAGLQSKE